MLSLFLFLLSSILCIICANMIKNDPKKVIDIVHQNVSELNYKYLSDGMVLLQNIIAIILLDFRSISQIFFILSITQFFRTLTTITTVLPPLKNYTDKFRLGGINGNGTEYIFSGHACYSCITFIYLYWKKSFPLSVLISYNFTSQFFIIATRNHYTVDVVLAWIIVPLVCGNLFFCEQISQCKNYINFLF